MPNFVFFVPVLVVVVFPFSKHLIRPLLLLGLQYFRSSVWECVLLFLIKVYWPSEEQVLRRRTVNSRRSTGSRVCVCVRGGSGICNGRRERVPGGPFPFSIAVCFLHPVIVGNEVGNTDRSSSFYFLLNAGTAGTRAPVTFFASRSHFESLHLSIPAAAAGLPLRTFLASEISLGYWLIHASALS
jgi:hypothetical protein